MAKEEQGDVAFLAGTFHRARCGRCGKGHRTCVPFKLGVPPAAYHVVLCLECANEWDDFILSHDLWARYEHAAEERRVRELRTMGGHESHPGNFYAACSALRGIGVSLRELARNWLDGQTDSDGADDT